VAQAEFGGWLSPETMDYVASILKIKPIEVFEVASFYTMFNRTKVGKYHLQVCGTTPCMVRGSEKIMETICNHLGVHDGETTKDGMFTV